jgi:GNAT superfamily N-acetyltransferase
VETERHEQGWPPLLVRRADAAAEEQVATLLRDVPVDPGQVAELVRQRGVLVLSDVTLPATSPPVAAAAFLIDPPTRSADLIGIGVAKSWRRKGVGRRLLTSALTVLRAAGVDRVRAWAHPGSQGASLLVSAGFIADDYTGDSGGRIRFLLLL